jgi:curved DNA-binding protein
MEFKDYYQVMGLARSATQDEIKRTYRVLARKYHPDVSKEANAEARFKEVGEAYEVLKDPEKRAAYDRLGADWKAGQEFRPPPDWNTGFEFSGGGFTDGSRMDFSDFFEALYGRSQAAGTHAHGRGSFHAHGHDHHARVLVDLEDSYLGASRTITLQVPDIDAQGRVTMHERRLNVNIPRGIRAGQHIRLTGQGAPAAGSGKPGDLYLEVGFRPHAQYRVDQRDVLLDLPVAPWEAALGATVTTPTPGGPVDLKIPPGAASGSKLRLKGRGLPGVGAESSPGDFYVILKIVLPAADSEAAQAFYSGMAGQFKAFHPREKLGV